MVPLKEKREEEHSTQWTRSMDKLSSPPCVHHENHDQPPSDDQGLAFQPTLYKFIVWTFSVRNQRTNLGVVTNRVLTIGAVCGKGLCVGTGGRSSSCQTRA